MTLRKVPEPVTNAQLLAAIERIRVDHLQMIALLQHLVGRPSGCSVCGVPADLHKDMDHLFQSQDI